MTALDMIMIMKSC